MELEVIRVCEKCGKPQTSDKEKSTENWIVYDGKKKCECGGRFIFKLADEK